VSGPGPRVVGTRARRIEDPALLRGRGCYLDDVRIEGVLHAAFVRSPHAHARIVSIDAVAALALPGVVDVLTAADLEPELVSLQMPLGFPSDKLPPTVTPQVLARDEVCYAGDAVAMVVAASRYVAEDAVNAIEVTYAPLPVVADCREALVPGAPMARSSAGSNVLERYRLAFGETGAAFVAGADGETRIVSDTLFVHRGAAHPIETRGVAARHDAPTGQLVVWSSTQMPHELLHMLADVLGIDASAVRVITPEVGGGFGAKFLVYPEELAVAAAARRLARPVKWIEDRREHFLAGIQERDQYWTLELAVATDGRIRGLRGRLVHDQGAYTPQATNVAYNAASSLTGPYMVPVLDLDVFVVQTNKPPVVPVRGAGYPESCFAMERMLDRAADALGMDRTELRARNLIPPEKMPYAKPLRNRAGVPITVDSGDYAVCQAKALAAAGHADFPERQAAARAAGRHLGFGVAHALKPTGRGPFEAARVSVTPAGKVRIQTGATAMGQGIGTSLAQVCAEQLGVPFDAIEVTAGDTADLSLGMGGFASRQAIMAGSAVHGAAGEVRGKALKVASQLLEAAESDLVLKDGHVEIDGVPGRGLTLAAIARKLKGSPGFALPKGLTPGLEATHHFQTDTQTYANACHACEVEVDIGTGGVRVLRYVAVHDSGRLLNPMIAEGQVHGGVAHGIGNALFEWMAYDGEAQPLTTTFADYLLPTAHEVSNVTVLFHESPSPMNPLGVKGLGETGAIPVAAAIIAAVEDALSPFGVKISEAPIRPVRILELLGQKR
jgi:carbon-monoxide dehydrogenase large subunit